MSDPFIGEIRTFGFTFAPVDWAQCNGAIIPVTQNPTLFSLLNNKYGGDGYNTFGLPELRGRVPMHYGTGPGLTTRIQGEKSGVEYTQLTTANLPEHNHDFNLSDNPGNAFNGNDAALAKAAVDTQTGQPTRLLETFETAPTYQAGNKLDTGTISNTGGGQAVYNLQPYLALNFCIALVGLYPSRN